MKPFKGFFLPPEAFLAVRIRRMSSESRGGKCERGSLSVFHGHIAAQSVVLSRQAPVEGIPTHRFPFTDDLPLGLYSPSPFLAMVTEFNGLFQNLTLTTPAMVSKIVTVRYRSIQKDHRNRRPNRSCKKANKILRCDRGAMP